MKGKIKKVMVFRGAIITVCLLLVANIIYKWVENPLLFNSVYGWIDGVSNNIICIICMIIPLVIQKQFATKEKERLERETAKKEEEDSRRSKEEETRKRESDNAKRNYREIQKNCLISELYRDYRNIMGAGIVDEVNKLKDQDIDGNIFGLLCNVEKCYNNIFLRYSNYDRIEKLSFKNSVKLIRDSINKVNEKGKRIISQWNYDIIDKILNIRSVEVDFMEAYSFEYKNSKNSKYFKTRREIIDAFIATVNLFRSYNNFNIIDIEPFPNEKVDKEVIDYVENLKDKSELNYLIVAYFLNIIGESYSKIVEYINGCPSNVVFPEGDNFESCKHKAVTYTKAATIVAKYKDCERVRYYRNFGCAIERVNAKNGDDLLRHIDEAIEQYEEAFRIDKLDQKTYYSIMSACNKAIEYIINLHSSKTSPPITEVNDLRLDDKRVEKYLIIYGKYTAIAQKCFPVDDNIIAMAAFYYRDKYMVSNEKNEKIKYAEEMKSCVETLKVLNPRWRYISTLEKDCNGIEDQVKDL